MGILVMAQPSVAVGHRPQVTISGPIVHGDHLPCPDHLGIPIVHEDGGERPPGVPQTITEEVTGSQVVLTEKKMESGKLEIADSDDTKEKSGCCTTTKCICATAVFVVVAVPIGLVALG